MQTEGAQVQIRLRVGPTLQSALGQSYVGLELPPGTSVEQFQLLLQQRYPELAPLLERSLVVAQGRVLSPHEAMPAGEVALLHPVAGG